MSRDDELAELSARVAHALRTPLGVVAGALEQLAIDGAGDRARLAELATRSLAQIARIADRLALVERIERGVSVSPQPASIRMIVANAVDQVSRGRRRRGVEISVTGAGEDAMFSGDAALLSAAIAELVDNALRCAKTSATVDVDAHAGTIVIANDGAPISASAIQGMDRARPFAPDRSGLGIGLWIAAKILAAHGLAIEPIAQPEGARFRVCLSRAP